MAENTPASSSPTTSASTVLTYSSAGLLRLSQYDIPQIATVVADFIRPLSIPGTELLSLSSSNLLQVLGSLLSSEESSKSLVPTPAFFDNASTRPCTKFDIGTLGTYVRHITLSVWCTTHMIRSCTAALAATLLLWNKIQGQRIEMAHL